MKTILIFILLLFGINNVNAQKTISFEAEGNLESPNPCDCVELLDVTNENNPADILIGMGKCMESKQFEKAARLFMIAGVYGKYDAFRVKDRSAHQAILVLQQNILLNVDESDRNSLMNSLKKYLDPTSEEVTNVCQVIQQIGIPKYYPKYMVQHGIQAFLESEGNGLNMEFDSEKSWNLVLKNYLHCGE
ncbi:hypothetical protein VP395_13245 [Mariniflexile soesokkakense]|uniref:Tetratricopeptide repeat protein n=1 Tax=Mariniflexile soesokkakense TaxID=1343160 RepID=A0ABV0ADR2_9FLAO